MRIIILDEEKITKLILPSMVSGAYIFQYGDDKNILNIEAEGEKWIAKSNGSINICDPDNIIAKVTLNDYDFYHLKIANTQQNHIMFCMPTLDNTFKKFTLMGNKLTIGMDNSNSIAIKVKFLEGKQFSIEKKDEEWHLLVEDESLNIYVNERRVKDAILKTGDSIFIYSINIIWFDTYIQINSPVGIVNIGNDFSIFQNNEIIDNTKYAPVKEEDSDISLYNKEDYFFHKPRFIQTVEEESIVIDAPPQTQIKEELPWLLTMGTSFTMLAFSSISVINLINSISEGKATTLSIVTTGLMSGSMLAGSLLFPSLTRKYNKRKEKVNERKRVTLYREYLNKKEKEISIIMEKQTQILKSSNMSFLDCYNFAINGIQNIWIRDINDEDFLQVRLGIGNLKTNIDIQAPEEHFTLEQDELKEAVYEMVNRSRELNEVPITYKFTNNPVSAIVCTNDVKSDYLNSILIQILSLHSPSDLKVISLFNKGNAVNFNYLKYMPHSFSNNKDIRFFSENNNETKNILGYLKKIYDERKKTNVEDNNEKVNYNLFDTYYLILCDNFMSIREIQIIDELVNSNTNYGFSLVLLDKNMQKLPKRCSNIITADKQSGAIIIKNLNDQQLFVPEYTNNLDMRKVATKLMSIPIMNTDFSMNLPTSITFLEMFKVSKISQLNIINSWKNNNPVISLQAPIGIHSDGEVFYLDLHEKYHGPHGLIAGSTGSGKSEFIITYILSMCISYHPDEVQFILIDYKGGGLSNAFYNEKTGIKVPHIAGILTNLDTSNMNRAIVSINSELKRRENIFNEAKITTGESTIDIYKYQKYYREGILKEPVSHLFIVSDEFAELKSQQPDFMANIISISRIGRSLGVHLILATQKPSGVVNDQIWSNSRFKVCLKVATRSDSMEMLKRPEAASLKETGRFYLQVGYDELFEIGQSGWSGAKYIPNDRIIKKHDDSISFVDNVGNIYKSVNDLVNVSTDKDMGDQLTNCVKYLTEIAEKLDYKTKKLWLDNIPAEIYLSKVMEKYTGVHKVTEYMLNPVIGEYDYPAIQSQGLLELDLLSKNTMIYGLNNSGLDEILKTIIFSLCVEHSPEEVNIYIVDMGAESLRIFNKFPQVGDICTVEDGDKILNMLMIGENEISRRKDLLADYSGDFKTYIETSGEKLPTQIFIINYYDVFTENFAKIADALSTLFRDGPKYGIEYILTGSTSSIRMKVAEFFQNKITLQLADNDQYRGLLGSPRGLIPAPYLARGLISLTDKGILEFQTAFIDIKNNVNETIKKVADLLSKKYTTKVPNVPVVPKIVSLSSIINNVRGIQNLILGYDVLTKMELPFNLIEEKITPIIATDLRNEISFIYAIIEEIKTVQNVNLKIIDVNNYIDFNKLKLVQLYNQDFNETISKIYTEATQINPNMTNIYLFTGIGKLKEKLNPDVLNLFVSMMTYVTKLTNSYFIFADSYEDYKQLQVELWYTKSVNSKYGIWLGPNVSNQIIITFNKLSQEEKRINVNDVGFVTTKTKNFVFKKVIIPEEESTDGE